MLPQPPLRTVPTTCHRRSRGLRDRPRPVVTRLPQIRRMPQVRGVGLLRPVPGPGKVSIQHRGRAVALTTSRPCWCRPRTVCAVDDWPRTKLRGPQPRVDRSAEPAAGAAAAGTTPRKTEGVDRRHLHHGDVNVASIVHQLGAQRLSESVDGVFGAAIGGLQGIACPSAEPT